MRRAVGWCNRGHAVFTEDELGIRRSYDCKDVHNEYEQVKARMEGLRLYLEEGLEDECRRAGCLPGWIR
jgi:chloramphenicol 3-O-phosphotransferase